MRKIGYKLFLGFGIVLSFTLIIVVIVYVRSSHLKELSMKFVGHDLPEIVMLNELRLYILEQGNALHLYLTTSQKEYLAQMIEKEEGGRRLLSMHKSLNVKDAQKEFEILTVLWRDYERFHDTCMESISLMEQGRRQEALTMYATEVNAAKDELIAHAQDLIALEDLEVRRQASIISQTVSSTRNFVAGMSVIILFLAAAVSFIITRSITRPLDGLVGTMRKASSGDLTVRSYISETDEIGFLAQSFNHMIEELEKAFTAQKHFLNDASHELRTPITVIKGHLEVLGRFEQPSYEEFQETKALLLDELDRMSAMVNSLLLLARAGEPQFYAKQEVELKPFMENLFRKACSMSGHHWVLGDVPRGVIMIGDRHRLTQVFLNLIENATFHTPPSGEIRLSAMADGDWVHVCVSDTGDGIPKAEQSQIFQRFYRIDKARTREHGGTGLGLAIVESIVQAHGGKVTVESEVGHGSIFTVSLPLTP